MSWEIRRVDGILERQASLWQRVVAEKARRLMSAEAARRGVPDDVVLVLAFSYDQFASTELVSLRALLRGDAPAAVQVVSRISSYDVTVGQESWGALTYDCARLAAALWPFGSAEEETAALLARAMGKR
jgi:hypothetical protein